MLQVMNQYLAAFNRRLDALDQASFIRLKMAI